MAGRPQSAGDIPPLAWPVDRHCPSQAQRFLRDVPIIGMDWRTRAFISRQLRTRPDVDHLWAADLCGVYKAVSAIIRDLMRWPNSRFIPEDPCEILFFDPTMELRAAEALAVIENRWQIEPAVLDGLARGPYGLLVATLARAPTLIGLADSSPS